MYKKALIIITALIMTVAVCALSAGLILPNGGSAHAGADDEILFTPIVYKDYLFPNEERGLAYHISCHPDTVELSYFFDNWLEEKSGKITLYKNLVSGRMENVLYDEDDNIIEGEYFIVRENGYYEFTAKLVKEDDESNIVSSLNFDFIIDYMPPKLDMAAENLLLEGSRPIGYEFLATDKYSSLQKQTAYSGLDTVIVFYDKDNLSPGEWDVTDKDKLTPQDIENSEQLEIIVSHKGLSSPGKAVYEQYFSFNFQGDGGYWVYLKDRAGNSRAERLWVINSGLEYLINIDGVNINIAPALDIAFQQISDGEAKYKPSILFNLNKTRYDLIYAFQTDKSEQEKKTAYHALRAAQKDYTEAKTTYLIDVVNGDMYPFDITLINLGQNTVTALLGETIRAEVIVTESTGGDWFNLARDASGIRANKIFKLSYKLTKDGEPIVPKEPIKFRITMPLRYDKTAVITPSNAGGYDDVSIQRGGEWLEFSSSYNNKDYVFAVYDTGESNGQNLLWLYIALGVLGGVGAAIGIYFGVKHLRGKNIRANKPKDKEASK